VCLDSNVANNGAVRLKHRLEVNYMDGREGGNVYHDFDHYIETGFQLATFQGPLCAEPMEGLAFFVESLEVDREGIEKETGTAIGDCIIQLPDVNDRTKPNGPGDEVAYFCRP
jgi:translation elongation factor EF-G